MDEFLGCIKIFGFNFNPRGWMTCQGQQLSIAQNSALFSLLGTTYGGNGQTTFGLPDLRGRVPVGQGQGTGLSPYALGQTGGFESVTLTQQQLPTHIHAATAQSTSTSATSAILTAETTQANAQNPAGKCLASGTNIYATEDPASNRQMASSCIEATTTTNTTTTVTVAPAGASAPVAILSPFLAVNYCICTEGIFPSRN